MSGEGLPMRIPIIISIVVVVVVVFRGRIGLGTLPNVLSALLEMLSLSTRPSSPSAAASHFRTLRAAACYAMLCYAIAKLSENGRAPSNSIFEKV